MAAVIQHNYKPRSYFKDFHARTERFACLVIHRRGGKTHAVLNDMVIRALRTKKKRWRGAYIAPVLGQAKDAAWEPLKEIVADFPGVVIRESDNIVYFPNGARIRVHGIDRPDSIRGGYLDFACLDEYQDMNPEVLSKVVMPMLGTRHGSLVVIGTPKGKNQLFTRFERAKKNSSWFTKLLTIVDTGEEALSFKEQEIQREELEDPEWNQEFMCSFTAEFRGAYYAKQLDELQAKGGFKVCPPDPREKVEAAMDVGRADATCIWFWQYVGGEVRVIDYFEATGLDAAETCDVLELKPYAYSSVWLPHDAFHHTWSSKKSGFDTFISRGIPARRTPKPDAGNRVYHGIDAVRKVLRTYPIVINTELCERGIDCLRNYSRKYDIKTKVYSDQPNHDQWSHGADAFRYLCLALNPSDIRASADRHRARQNIQQFGTAQINTPLAIKRATLDDLYRDHMRRAVRKDRINY